MDRPHRDAQRLGVARADPRPGCIARSRHRRSARRSDAAAGALAVFSAGGDAVRAGRWMAIRDKGQFLPPVPLPRRMWAGSRVRVPLGLCASARKSRGCSRIAAVNIKQGRSGALVFVKVAHEVPVRRCARHQRRTGHRLSRRTAAGYRCRPPTPAPAGRRVDAADPGRSRACCFATRR